MVGRVTVMQGDNDDINHPNSLLNRLLYFLQQGHPGKKPTRAGVGDAVEEQPRLGSLRVPISTILILRLTRDNRGILGRCNQRLTFIYRGGAPLQFNSHSTLSDISTITDNRHRTKLSINFSYTNLHIFPRVSKMADDPGPIYGTTNLLLEQLPGTRQRANFIMRGLMALRHPRLLGLYSRTSA